MQHLLELSLPVAFSYRPCLAPYYSKYVFCFSLVDALHEAAFIGSKEVVGALGGASHGFHDRLASWFAGFRVFV